MNSNASYTHLRMHASTASARATDSLARAARGDRTSRCSGQENSVTVLWNLCIKQVSISTNENYSVYSSCWNLLTFYVHCSLFVILGSSQSLHRFALSLFFACGAHHNALDAIWTI